MANRGPLPALTVRNMLRLEFAPRSSTRAQVGSADGLIHVETDQSPSRSPRVPFGSVTYDALWQKSSAVPIRPGRRSPSARQFDVGDPSVHWMTGAPGSVLMSPTPSVSPVP